MKRGSKDGGQRGLGLGLRNVASLGCLASGEKHWRLQTFQKQAASLACKSRPSIETSQLKQAW